MSRELRPGGTVKAQREDTRGVNMEPNQRGHPRSCVSAAATPEPGVDTGSSEGVWRPWHDAPGTQVPQQCVSGSLAQPCIVNQEPFNDKVKMPTYQHPVKLFWPKSKCYDFLYQDAESLLRNFPVQATISFYEETDSEGNSEDENSDN